MSTYPYRLWRLTIFLKPLVGYYRSVVYRQAASLHLDIHLLLMHIIQHCLCLRVYGIAVPAVAEQTHEDDDVPLQRKAFLGSQERILEAGAAAEGDDFIGSDYSQ